MRFLKSSIRICVFSALAFKHDKVLQHWVRVNPVTPPVMLF